MKPNTCHIQFIEKHKKILFFSFLNQTAIPEE